MSLIYILDICFISFKNIQIFVTSDLVTREIVMAKAAC